MVGYEPQSPLRRYTEQGTPMTSITPFAPLLIALAVSSPPEAKASGPAAELEDGIRLQKTGEYDEAIRVLEAASRQKAEPAVAADILLELGKTLFLKGKAASDGRLEGTEFEPILRRALAVFQRLLAAHPEATRPASIAAYLTGSSHILLGDMTSALAAYTRAYQDYPESEYRPRALVRIGVCLAGTGDAKRALQIYDAFLKHYRARDDLKALKSKVSGYIRQLQIVGRPAPRLRADEWLRGVTPNGLEDLRGEVVVLVFLASWCKNCGSELPHLKREISRWSERGVVFLGIADPVDPKAREPIDFYLERHGVDLTDVALDRRAKSWSAYRVTGLPAVVVIDREGIVRWRGHLAFIGHTILERLLGTRS